MGSPRTLAERLAPAVRATVCERAWAACAHAVTQPHRFAHVAHGLLRELARLFAAVGDDVAHQRRVVQVTSARAPASVPARPAPRRSPAACTRGSRCRRCGSPDCTHCSRLVVGIDQVELPHRALVRIAGVAALYPRRVGRHGAHLLRHRFGVSRAGRSCCCTTWTSSVHPARAAWTTPSAAPPARPESCARPPSRYPNSRSRSPSRKILLLRPAAPGPTPAPRRHPAPDSGCAARW